MSWKYSVTKAENVTGCTRAGDWGKGRRKMCLLGRKVGLHVGLEFPGSDNFDLLCVGRCAGSWGHSPY